jgi:hypothetical protein
MKSLPHIILQRLRASADVLTSRDFLDIGSRAAVDKALSRLSRDGSINRIGRGLYHVPRVNARLGISVPPDADNIADALARQTGSRLLPSGAAAANRLGLSTQVPAKAVYLTDGRSRRWRSGNLDIQFKHVAPSNFKVRHHASALVFQALRYLGKDNVGDRTLKILSRALTPDQRRGVLDDARHARGWVASVVKGLDRDDHTIQNPSHG